MDNKYLREKGLRPSQNGRLVYGTHLKPSPNGRLVRGADRFTLPGGGTMASGYDIF